MKVISPAVWQCQKELTSMPFSAVWDYYCLEKNVPIGMDFLSVIKTYKMTEISKLK